MNPNLQRLFEIAQKPSRLIVGLMSGTSLDGLDVAVCRFKGNGPTTECEVLAFETMPYDEAFKAEIRRVFAKKQVDFQHLTLLNAVIGARHAESVLAVLARLGFRAAEIDLIASHGQTVFHAPNILHGLDGWPNATLQIGDGDHVAVKTGIVTVSDFRQKHVAAGGEGAPLALYGDFLLFSKLGEHRALLNIGGISNFTWLPATGGAEGAFATDTGPGNALLDRFSQLLMGKPFDEGGRSALAGRPDERLLKALKSDAFFEKPFPKTTGPELFNIDFVQKAQAASGAEGIGADDLMATLARFTAETIAEALRKTASSTGTRLSELNVFLSGGGAHNEAIATALRSELSEAKFEKMSALGIDGDAKEAVLFAALANETVAGRPDALRFGKQSQPSVSMGKISMPS